MAKQIADKKLVVGAAEDYGDGTGWVIESDDDIIGVSASSDIAARLTACWNACIGIPTEMLETADPERQPAIYSIQAKRIAQLELQVIALKGGEVSNAA